MNQAQIGSLAAVVRHTRGISELATRLAADAATAPLATLLATHVTGIADGIEHIIKQENINAEQWLKPQQE